MFHTQSLLSLLLRVTLFGKRQRDRRIYLQVRNQSRVLVALRCVALLPTTY